LRDAVNEALRMVKADGTLTGLNRKWITDPTQGSE
jgi:ABC-type amino acid transport substrate-binding protein